MKIFNVVAAALLVAVAQAQSYTDIIDAAPDSDYLFKVNSASVSPSPPCPGNQFCLTVSGDLQAPFTTASTFIFIGSLTSSSNLKYYHSVNVCEQLASQGVACPTATGPTTVTICDTIQPTMPID
ncbi:hypothetical protein BGZ76_007904, partial [Entomortierella beljakovae]